MTRSFAIGSPARSASATSTAVRARGRTGHPAGEYLLASVVPAEGDQGVGLGHGLSLGWREGRPHLMSGEVGSRQVEHRLVPAERHRGDEVAEVIDRLLGGPPARGALALPPVDPFDVGAFERAPVGQQDRVPEQPVQVPHLDRVVLVRRRGEQVHPCQPRRRVHGFRRRSFDRAASALGLTGLVPHELRHTAASLAIASGANVKALQSMLGHASAAMTLDRYSHLFDDALDAVADRLDEARQRAAVPPVCP